MKKNEKTFNILLVDDEEDFRQICSVTLGRRGFNVTQATDGEAALKILKKNRPDIVILDLKMSGMNGIETLQKIRDIEPILPVIILTGHGNMGTAMAGIKLEVVDFIQKPVDMNQLGIRIKGILERGGEKPLCEPTITDLMTPPELYPKVYVDESIHSVLKTIHAAYLKPVPQNCMIGQVRSALVYEGNEKFIGIVRFSDFLRLILPSFLSDSPYSSFFTGMFLAQCKVVASKINIRELVNTQVFIEVNVPLMEAVHLLVKHKRINIPVMKNDELVGILRSRDIILEAARSMWGK